MPPAKKATPRKAAEPPAAPPAELPCDVDPADAALTIYERMNRIIADLPAIGKDQFNKQQGFAFRGVDAVLDALHPLLARHGVFFAPSVIERDYTQRTTAKGGVMHVVNLHVEYKFFGASGDSFTASGWGEGTDSGDKATNKAMTGAMKYVLFQVFAIATNDSADDADASTPDETVVDERPPYERLGFETAADAHKAAESITQAARALNETQRVTFNAWRTTNRIGWPVEAARVEVVQAQLQSMLEEPF